MVLNCKTGQVFTDPTTISRFEEAPQLLGRKGIVSRVGSTVYVTSKVTAIQKVKAGTLVTTVRGLWLHYTPPAIKA